MEYAHSARDLPVVRDVPGQLPESRGVLERRVANVIPQLIAVLGRIRLAAVRDIILDSRHVLMELDAPELPLVEGADHVIEALSPLDTSLSSWMTA